MPLLFAALLLVADPATPTAATAAPPAETAQPAKEEKKICKTDTNESSSRLRRRVCLTETEWARKEAGKTAGDLKTIGAR